MTEEPEGSKIVPTKIVVAEPANYSTAALETYASIGSVVIGRPDRGWILSNLSDVGILVVRLGVTIDEELLIHAPNLKLVATSTTGLNHVDVDACARRRVEVISLRGESGFLKEVTATAEHAWGLLLAVVRGTVRAHEHVLTGGWDRESFRGRELSSLTIGLVGIGRVGRMMAGYAHAFGMNVLGYDPYVQGTSSAGPELQWQSLDDLLRESDIVSLHVSHTPETDHLMNATRLGRMKKGAFLVNTSRGEIIDERALEAAIQQGSLGGVALDVLDAEHEHATHGHHPLASLARSGFNVILTPHIAGCTLESMEKTEAFIALKVLVLAEARRWT